MSVHEEVDPIGQRLAALADTIEREVGEAVVVERDHTLFAGAVSLQPRRVGALGVSWIDMGWDLQVQTAGGLGGRWELGRSSTDVDFIEDVVRSVIAGRVVEVRVANRSRVTVTLGSGERAVETGAQGLSGCLPLPFWPRWGRKVRYLPYAER